VSCGQAYFGVQGSGQAPRQGNGGLDGASFDALDLVGRHVRAPGQISDAKAQGAALVVDGLAEDQSLADGDPLGIIEPFRRPDAAGAVAGHHTCPFVGLRRSTVVLTLAQFLRPDRPVDLPLVVLAGPA
jgi:hypothetical protein